MNANSPWKKHEMKDIEALYKLVYGYLTDDVFMLLFLHELLKVKDNMRTYFAKTYDFTIEKDWWGIDELSLCSPIDTLCSH